MAARAKVVDASALAALLFGEPRAEELAAKLEGGPLVAPTLLTCELASVALKKLRQYPERRAALLAALSLVERMDVRLVDVDAVAVADLADREGITAYDAAYFWVARTLQAELVTQDGPLWKRFSRGRAKAGRRSRRPTR